MTRDAFIQPLARRQFLRPAAACLAWAAVQAAGAAIVPADRPVLRFGLFTARDPEKMLADWKPFVGMLSKAIGREVEGIATTESEIVAAFKAGQMDLAWLGNVPALDLVESRAAAIFGQIVTKEGSSGYASVIVVPTRSTVHHLDDVIQRAPQLRMAMGETKSVSGYLVPLYYAFAKRRVNDPARLFANVSTGSNRQNLLAAAEGRVDVAISNTEELRFLHSAQPQLARGLRVVWTSPEIPQSPLVWSLKLPADLRQRIQEFCIGFGSRSAAEAAALRKVNLGGFKRAKNQQLIPIADIQMFLEWQRINNDSSLTASDKQKRIEAVVRRGSQIELLLKMGSGV